MKIALNNKVRDEKGQALILVLILLLVGGLIIAPLLAYMSTGLKAGGVFENKMYELYAADAGIEDALWKLGNAEEVPLNPSLDPTDYDTQWPPGDPYQLPDNINHKGVTYTITPIWPLEGLETGGSPTPPPTTPTVTGFVHDIGEGDTEATYQVDLTYDDSLGTLKVAAVKVWLPASFGYVLGSSQGITTGNPTLPPTEYRGGKVLVWNLSEINFEDLARPEPQEGEFFPADEFPMKRTLMFNFSPAGNPRGAISWLVGTTTTDGDCFAWDTTCEFYKIVSTAGNTIIESYTSKEKIKEKGAVTTVYGDYTAIGNSLMVHTHIDGARWFSWEWYCNRYGIRQTAYETVYGPSSADIPDSVPAQAEVFRAYLYWSGWKEGAEGEEYDPENLGDLAELVNTATFNGTPLTGTPVNPVRVQIIENTYGWSYSCRMDVTELMPESWIATYTVGDVNADLGDSRDWAKDQWAYAGWSLVILYSDPSPEAKAHNIYLYDRFLYADERTDPPADTHIFTIKGFKVPDDSEGVLTCFVGEGDDFYGDHQQGYDDEDYIKVNGEYLEDLPTNPKWNIMNGKSSGLDGLEIDGVDIDTFDIAGYINEGDTSAVIELGTGYEIWNLVYIILSLRSDIYGPMGENTVGSITYKIGG